MIAAIRKFIRRWRDSITGRFVSRDYAEKHPDTTQSETRS
jgi:hypothetical protein